MQPNHTTRSEEKWLLLLLSEQGLHQSKYMIVVLFYIATDGNGNRNFAMREWLIQNPEGLKSNFEEFFDKMAPTEKQVWLYASDLCVLSIDTNILN